MLVVLTFENRLHYVELPSLTLARLSEVCQKRIRGLADSEHLYFLVRDKDDQWFTLKTDAALEAVLRLTKRPIIKIAIEEMHVQESDRASGPDEEKVEGRTGRAVCRPERLNQFGLPASAWDKVTAEQMLREFSNRKYHFCTQREWLDEYWRKLGLTTDSERAWSVPEESDEMGWDLETWGSFVR